MVAFNGAYYTYLHNLQEDAVGLVDSGNNIVVEYKYDAWGKPTLKRTLTTAYDTLATLNPFRYRGYVYDEETALAYGGGSPILVRPALTSQEVYTILHVAKATDVIQSYVDDVHPNLGTPVAYGA